MMRKFPTNGHESTQRCIRFSKATDDMVQELRDILTPKYPLLFGGGPDRPSFGMIVERSVQSFMESVNGDEEALRENIEWIKANAYPAKQKTT